MMSCCHSHKPEPTTHTCHDHSKRDYLLWATAVVLALAIAIHLSGAEIRWVSTFAHTATHFLHSMWWGIVAGIIFVGMLSFVPQSFVLKVLGKPNSKNGIIRAGLAGLLLDLCSHGILLVAMQLYKRGASLAQVMTFLIASPWNSLSLTIIMVSLMGLGWTVLFIVLSLVIALVSGFTVAWAERKGWVEPNPFAATLPDDFRFWKEAKTSLATVNWRPALAVTITKRGFSESRSILRWLFLGVILAALLKTFVSDESFAGWFGPSAFGLVLTLIAATIIEVCSEGSTPIASDLLTRAGAPGNAFAFLMAGASTDYTEIMGLKETTGKWRPALLLPLVTLPQIVALGLILNHWG